MPKLPKVKHVKISTLKRKAWKAFSWYIRTKGAWLQGDVLWNKCYTCDKSYPCKMLQAGHFISRTQSATMFDPRNVRPQCFADNIWRRGASHEFAAKLIEEIGLEEFNSLIAKGRAVHPFTVLELEDIIKKYS